MMVVTLTSSAYLVAVLGYGCFLVPQPITGLSSLPLHTTNALERCTSSSSTTSLACSNDNDNNTTPPSLSPRRRSIVTTALGTAATTTLSSFLLLHTSTNNDIANANAIMTEGNPSAERVRRAASNLPGYGPPDILYPPYFQGRWDMTRTLVLPSSSYNNNNKSNEDQSTTTTTTITLHYPVRFLPRQDGTTIIVVADRAFNEQSYGNAMADYYNYNNDNDSNNNNNNNNRRVRTVEWVVTNPNVMNIFYTDGSTKEIKVTKRSFDFDNNEQQPVFFSSEYRRVTNVAAAESTTTTTSSIVGGIPVITANRVLTKWRPASSSSSTNIINVIEGLELIYADENSSVGDPMMATSISIPSSSSSPKLLLKSRLRLERVKEDTN